MLAKRLDRRALFRAVVRVSAASTLAGAGAVPLLAERFSVQVEALSLRIPTLPAALDGLRIVHMSDFHHGAYTPSHFLERIVERVNGLQPDLVVLTGDFITHDVTYLAPCTRLLGGLKAPLGRYAVLGNHDYRLAPDRAVEQIERDGIRVLRNERLPLAAGLWLAGLDSAYMGNHSLAATFREGRVGGEETTILLAHEPDIADEVRHYPVDLMLAGHSHGGQIRVPLMGAPFLPWLGRRYPMGLARFDRLHLYTTRGIGVHDRLPLRLNCPPEITHLTLRARA